VNTIELSLIFDILLRKPFEENFFSTRISFIAFFLKIKWLFFKQNKLIAFLSCGFWLVCYFIHFSASESDSAQPKCVITLELVVATIESKYLSSFTFTLYFETLKSRLIYLMVEYFNSKSIPKTTDGNPSTQLNTQIESGDCIAGICYVNSVSHWGNKCIITSKRSTLIGNIFNKKTHPHR